MKKPRCLFYTQDGYGMGHIARVSALAKTLKYHHPQWDVVVVTGDKTALQMLPESIELVKLPSLEVTADDENCMKITPAALSTYSLVSILRRQILSSLMDSFVPDVVVVEHLARGLGRELAPSLVGLKKKHPDSRLVLGLRGIIGSNQRFYEKILTPTDMDFIDNLYDNVLIYIDKSVVDVRSYYKLPAWFDKKMLYTGYVVPQSPQKKDDVNDKDDLGLSSEEPYLGVALGSGVAADGILANILEALSSTEGLPKKKIIVTGPKLSYESYRGFTKQYPKFIFHRFIPNYLEFVAGASFFIGLGGYNTISAWLKSKCPALLISRSQESQNEQLLHLEALASLGLCATISESESSVSRLATILKEFKNNSNHQHEIATGGEIVVADFINNLIP